MALYRGAVINAFADVERALNAVRLTARREFLQRAAVNSARRAFEISETQLREGAVDLVNVLNAQQQLFQAQDVLAVARLARLQATVGRVPGARRRLADARQQAPCAPGRAPAAPAVARDATPAGIRRCLSAIANDRRGDRRGDPAMPWRRVSAPVSRDNPECPGRGSTAGTAASSSAVAASAASISSRVCMAVEEEPQPRGLGRHAGMQDRLHIDAALEAAAATAAPPAANRRR